MADAWEEDCHGVLCDLRVGDPRLLVLQEAPAERGILGQEIKINSLPHMLYILYYIINTIHIYIMFL